MGTRFAGSESTCSSFKDPLSVSQLFGFVQALATSGSTLLQGGISVRSWLPWCLSSI
jgi:hypothetical protein